MEKRLLNTSLQLQQDLERIRKKVAFERLLARLFDTDGPQWLLKGGYAMELRFHSEARATQDLDMVLTRFASPGPFQIDILRETLAESANRDLGDYFEFRVAQAKRQLQGPKYGGARYPVVASIGGRRFVQFSLDVAVGDRVVEPVDVLQVDGWLSGYGFPPVQYRVINMEQQFAEKLHAYTFQQTGRPNTRVKDLVDLFLLSTDNRLDRSRLSKCIREVFQNRKTHELPGVLQFPPDDWKNRFEAMAKECGIRLTLAEAFDVVARFLDKALGARSPSILT